MHDQDALNAILYNKSFTLPCKWNMLHFFFYPDSKSVQGFYQDKLLNDYSEYKKQLIYDRKNPAVIHYVSKPKPWQKGCVHPFTKEYFKYARKTITFSNLTEPKWQITNLKIMLNKQKLYFNWVLRSIYYKLIKQR